MKIVQMRVRKKLKNSVNIWVAIKKYRYNNTKYNKRPSVDIKSWLKDGMWLWIFLNNQLLIMKKSIRNGGGASFKKKLNNKTKISQQRVLIMIS